MSIKTPLTLLLVVSMGAQAQTTGTCVDNTFLCSSCTVLEACFGQSRYPVSCASGQICGNDGVDPNIDGCFDISDSRNKKQFQCSCDPSMTDPSFIADGLSEDPASYLACQPGSSAPEASLVCNQPLIFLDGRNPPCGYPPSSISTPTPFECIKPGFSRDVHNCGDRWFCQDSFDRNPSGPYSCPTGQTFYEESLSCQDPCVHTFSCFGTRDGAVADYIDCSIFHICVNGAALGAPISCPLDEYFDEASQHCRADIFKCQSTIDPCHICPSTEAPSTFADLTSEGDSSTSYSDSTDTSTKTSSDFYLTSAGDSSTFSDSASIDESTETTSTVSDSISEGDLTTISGLHSTDESDFSENGCDSDKGQLSVELNIHVQVNHDGSDQQQNKIDFYQSYKIYDN